MLKVHVSDGRTLSFDLAREDDARRLAELQRDPRFAASLTALTILRDGVMYSLARPRGKVASFVADETQRGESVRLFAGEASVSMMVHARQRAVRVQVGDDGRRVWWPER